jgi:hemoglobin
MDVTNHHNLFTRIGGINGLHDIVDRFYDKVLEDKQLIVFFDGADMNVQRGKMKAFLMMALGGPVKFTGKDMRHAHVRLVDMGLNDRHFDLVGAHLIASLEEYNVPEDICNGVKSLLESVRADVLNH